MNTAKCIKKVLLPTLLLFAAIHPLSACSRTLTVEPDAHDPNLHGQVVRFTVPMAYVELSEVDIDEFDKKSMEIGRILTKERTAQSLYNMFGDKNVTNVAPNMNFTILESYWVRQDWFYREFAHDVHVITLKDENGIISSSMRLILLDSNKPELAQ